jgi:hypothetical protein
MCVRHDAASAERAPAAGQEPCAASRRGCPRLLARLPGPGVRSPVFALSPGGFRCVVADERDDGVQGGFECVSGVLGLAEEQSALHGGE